MTCDQLRPAPGRAQTARLLCKVSMLADGGTVVAVIVGREDAAACVGALSTALRSAALLLEGPTQR